jgi:hypothetical protein
LSLLIESSSVLKAKVATVAKLISVMVKKQKKESERVKKGLPKIGWYSKIDYIFAHPARLLLTPNHASKSGILFYAGWHQQQF